MNRYLQLLLACLLVIGSIPFPVIAQDNELEGIVWDKQVNAEITKILTDGYGDVTLVGDAEGYVYAYDSSGALLYDDNHPARYGEMPVTKIVASENLHTYAVLTSDGTNYRVDFASIDNKTPWYTISSSQFSLGVVADNEKFVVVATSSLTNNKSYVGVFSQAEQKGYWFITPALVPDIIDIDNDNGNYLIGKSAKTTTQAVSILLSELPPLSEFPPLSELPPLSEFPPPNSRLYKIFYTSASVDYQQEIIIYRTDGDSYAQTIAENELWHIFVGDIVKSDYSNLRFYDDRFNLIPYYVHSGITSNSATITVRLPAGKSTGYLAVEDSLQSLSNPDTTFDFYDDFSGLTIDNTKWEVSSNVSPTLSNGICSLPPPGHDGIRLRTKKTFAGDIKIEVKMKKSIGKSWIAIFTCDQGVSDVYSHGYMYAYYSDRDSKLFRTYGTDNLQLIGQTSYSIPDNVFLTYQILSAPPVQRDNFGLNATDTIYSAGKISIGAHKFASVEIDKIVVRSAAVPAPHFLSLDRYALGLDSITKSYTGDIQQIVTSKHGNYAAIQTISNLYYQALNSDGSFGSSISMGTQTGTPYALDISDDGNIIISGRGSMVGIYRRDDGVQVGTYSAGGNINAVSVSRHTGLFASATSDDGKVYVFSKDAASTWYLLYSSASTMPNPKSGIFTGYGTILVYARGNTVYAFSPAESVKTDGNLKLIVFYEAETYKNVNVWYEQGGKNQVWGSPQKIITDTYGVAYIPVIWGDYVRITIGNNELQKIVVANPQQTEYILRVTGELPLRTGANYGAVYDVETNQIHFYYEDLRFTTHRLELTISRASDKVVVDQRTFYAPAEFPVAYTYQIPPGMDNTNYYIRMKCYGSPTYENQWSVWVGTDGIIPLPDGFSTEIRIGIFFVLILFVAGLFSYATGPQGAVIVSLLTGFLVLIKWLPLSPSIVAIAIVWAFIGLFGAGGRE